MGNHYVPIDYNVRCCNGLQLLGKLCHEISMSSTLLTLYQTSPGSYLFAAKDFWKHWNNYSLSQCFLPVWRTFCIFIYLIFVCKLLQFGRVQNLSFGKGLNKTNLWDFFPVGSLQVCTSYGSKKQLGIVEITASCPDFLIAVSPFTSYADFGVFQFSSKSRYDVKNMGKWGYSYLIE